jgi:hypothetical protein
VNAKACLILIQALTALTYSAAAQESPSCITNVVMTINTCDTNVCSLLYAAPYGCASNRTDSCHNILQGGVCMISSNCSTNDGATVKVQLYSPAPKQGYTVGTVTIYCDDGTSSTKNITFPGFTCWATFTLCASCPPCSLSIGVIWSSTSCCSSGQSPQEAWFYTTQDGEDIWFYQK